jgi:peptidoglycan hydrolase-like protein with peptidoglycan-binding domain
MTSFYFGLGGDVPIAGDWDCDGVDTPGMYRPADGFVYLRNSSTTGPADVSFYFGLPDDVPIAGDWDGDGCDTVGVLRPAEARLYLTNGLETGYAEVSYDLGTWGDVPLAADIDADGIDEVGVYRPSDGSLHLFFDHEPGTAELTYPFGGGGLHVVTGDWDADGYDTFATWSPRDGAIRTGDRLGEGAGNFVAARGLDRLMVVAGRFGPACATNPARCTVPAPQLERGDTGAWVADLRTALAAAGYRPGEGTEYDAALRGAVLAFQKQNWLPRDGVFHAYQWDMVLMPVEIPARDGEPDRVEVDLARQVLYLVEDDALAGVVPISSGNGDTYRSSSGNLARAVTPEGDFSFYRQASGWYRSYLGSMYRPVFFRGGYAVHGSSSVPAYPASHGCVRVQNWDMDWLRTRVELGMPVHVYGIRVTAPAS